jgi:RND family efflux transporter MFP subunit
MKKSSSQSNAVLAQQKTVWDLESKLDLIPTDLEVAKANMNVALAQQNSAQRSLDRTQISLPFNGQIGKVNVELGQVVNLQQTLLTADDLRIMEVTANMSLSDMRRLISATSGNPRANGQTIPDIRNLPLNAQVLLMVSDQQYVWPAKVDRIDGSIDAAANTIGLTVQVSNPVQDFDPRLSPPLVKDMYVEVHVSSAGKDTIVIPSKALHGNRVYVLNPDKTLSIRAVHVSYQQDDKTAIDHGLEQGEWIIETDILAPSNGMQVRLLNNNEDEAKP